MSKPLKVRAKLACDIAGIDRDRFNEAVAAGTYLCAPMTSPGSARIFEEPDLIALFVYGRLISLNMDFSLASAQACRVGDQARQMRDSGNEIAGSVTIGFAEDGKSACQIETEPTIHNPDGKVFAGRGDGSPVVFVLTFPVGNILKIIRKRIEDHLSILGED